MTLVVPDHREDEDPRGEIAQRHGSTLANISRRLVGLHKEFYGKGPTKARTYVEDDVVLVLLRGGYTVVEETLRRDGRMEAVQRQRDAFQEVMHERFVEVIEEELGRKVVAFMNTSHQDPDLTAEIFVLEAISAD